MSAHHPFRPDMPSARVIKDGPRKVPLTHVRDGLRDWFTLTDEGRERLAIVMGLWPLILVGGMVIALLWTAGYHSVQP